MDAEDDRWSVKNSEEIEAIHFEWTPDLVRLATSRRRIHPFLGPLEETDWKWPYYIYRPDMVLPDPANTHECLKWVGLSDEKIIQVEQRFNELYPDFQAPVCGYDEYFSPTGHNSIVFPVLDKMVRVYQRMLDDWSSDHEYTHEGYIKKGIQQGLRPEFAVFCGMHKDDPRCIDDPLLFEREWFDISASSLVDDIADWFWRRLRDFLTSKLLHEGKAWSDKHGHWLVHEGEDIDQAKARVNDLDLEQLRERADKELREKSTRKTQEEDRQTDLEVAEAEAEYRAARGE